MIKEAIQFLIGQGAQATAQQNLPDHLRIISGDHSVESIEKHLPNRMRYRTQISTSSIDDFVALTMERKDVAETFINAEKRSARSIFNLGGEADPGHGDHWAELTLKSTVEFDEMLKQDGRAMPQQAMAEWLEDWAAFLAPVYEESEHQGLTIKDAIRNMRNVEIKASKDSGHQVQNFGAERSEVDRILMKGKDFPLPAGFTFRCVPYDGLSERTILMRLSMSMRGGDPHFTLRIVRKDQVEREIIVEFRDLLVSRLEGARVVIGTVSI